MFSKSSAAVEDRWPGGGGARLESGAGRRDGNERDSSRKVILGEIARDHLAEPVDGIVGVGRGEGALLAPDGNLRLGLDALSSEREEKVAPVAMPRFLTNRVGDIGREANHLERKCTPVRSRRRDGSSGPF